MEGLYHQVIVWYKKYGLVCFAYILVASLNYNPQLLFKTSYRHWGWNLALLATILTLIIFRLRNPLDWKSKLGIGFKHKDWFRFILFTILLLMISYFLVSHLSELSGFSFLPKLIHYKEFYPPEFPFFPILGEYLYYIPETFNEEILIGAFLLMGLQRHFVKLNNTVIAIGVALFFSFMHYAFYQWNPLQSGIMLTIPTTLSLFFIGILRNALILQTRKIVYAWAIHLSFNLIFLPGYFINDSNEKIFREAEKFNLVFGHQSMVFLTGILAVMAMVWLNANKIRTYLAEIGKDDR